jgi:hypothetical protein
MISQGVIGVIFWQVFAIYRQSVPISPYKAFGENLGGLVMSFYKSLVKIMLMPTALVSIACTSHPTTSPTPALESELTLTQKLQNTLNDFIKNSNIQGVSSAILMPNKEIWLGVSGMSDPTIEEQITPEMLFDIASTGKNYGPHLSFNLLKKAGSHLKIPSANGFRTIQILTTTSLFARCSITQVAFMNL